MATTAAHTISRTARSRTTLSRTALSRTAPSRTALSRTAPSRTNLRRSVRCVLGGPHGSWCVYRHTRDASAALRRSFRGDGLW